MKLSPSFMFLFMCKYPSCLKSIKHILPFWFSKLFLKEQSNSPVSSASQLVCIVKLCLNSFSLGPLIDAITMRLLRYKSKNKLFLHPNNITEWKMTDKTANRIEFIPAILFLTCFFFVIYIKRTFFDSIFNSLHSYITQL